MNTWEHIKLNNQRTDRSHKLNPGIKGILLVVGAYIVTMVVTTLLIVGSVTFNINTNRCSALSQALPVLWGAIALVFLISVVVVGVVTWKAIASAAGRLAIMVVYAVMMLVSFIGFAFGLLVAFNC